MDLKEKKEIASIVSSAVSTAVAVAVEKELGQYKVPKEQHYQDHMWIKEVMEWTDTIKNSVVKSAVNIMVLGFFGILLLGFIFWGKSNLHP